MKHEQLLDFSTQRSRAVNTLALATTAALTYFAMPIDNGAGPLLLFMFMHYASNSVVNFVTDPMPSLQAAKNYFVTFAHSKTMPASRDASVTSPTFSFKATAE